MATFINNFKTGFFRSAVITLPLFSTALAAVPYGYAQGDKDAYHLCCPSGSCCWGGSISSISFNDMLSGVMLGASASVLLSLVFAISFAVYESLNPRRVAANFSSSFSEAVTLQTRR